MTTLTYFFKFYEYIPCTCYCICYILASIFLSLMPRIFIRFKTLKTTAGAPNIIPEPIPRKNQLLKGARCILPTAYERRTYIKKYILFSLLIFNA